MSKPRQVVKQLEEIDELYKQMEGANADPNANPSPDPDAAPNQSLAPPDNQPVPPKEDDTLLQKYRTLQGMYNAEVPRLQADKKALEARVANLEAYIAQNANSPAPQAPKPRERQKLITDGDLEEYGDAVDVMRRAAREEADAAYGSQIEQMQTVIEALQKQLHGQVMPQVANVTQRQVATQEQQFWGRLNELVPDWAKINDDPDFQTWLLAKDPLTGITRQTYLEDAQAALDPVRVASFFNVWTEMGNPTTPKPPTDRSAVLQQHVQPGQSRATPAPQQPKTYTRQFVAQFYRDITSGKYKGREQERAKIENDIFRAQEEGRIT